MSKSNNLKYFLDKFHIFHDYLTKTQGENFILTQLRELFEKAYSEQNERRLKKLNSELDKWIRELPPHEKDELFSLLNKKLGEGSVSKDDEVNRIIKRGSINNRWEYALILQRVEEIFSDEGKKPELTILNQLLADFHING